MNKFKNYGLWVSLFALLALVLQDFIPSFDLGRYQEYVDIILVILVGAGVISDPKAGKWFKDEVTEEENKGV